MAGASSAAAPVPERGSAPAAAPAPQAGSARYFMLLYAPPARRELLATLLALAAELASGITHRLDHGVAHVRLEWWREEARRLATGAPTHPWLRGQRSDQAYLSAALALLVDAAAHDLANERLNAIATLQLGEQLFLQSAVALVPAALGPVERTTLVELGRCLAALEELAALPMGTAVPAAAAAAASLSWLRSHQAAGPLIEPALQPPLAPLLVWIAISARQVQRRGRRATRKSATMAASPLDGFVDNIVAWRCARSALRGELRISLDERLLG